MSLQYTPHLLYSLAITSIGIHLLSHRKDAESAQHRVAARLSILDTTAQRLRAGEVISDRELARLRKLAQGADAHPGDMVAREETAIGWREVLFGSGRGGGREAGAEARSDEWDRRDLERGEWIRSPRVCMQSDVPFSVDSAAGGGGVVVALPPSYTLLCVYILYGADVYHCQTF